MSDRSSEKYEQQKEMSRNWKKNNPERHAELAREYRARNKEKTKAQNQLNYAVRKGLIERQPCETCGTSERIHAHHHDYSEPFDVQWLCYKCHKKAHPVTEEDKRIKFEGAKRADINGSENPNSKLSDENVREIRKLLEVKFSQERIAEMFGVYQTTISKIKRGISYANVK